MSAQESQNLHVLQQQESKNPHVLQHIRRCKELGVDEVTCVYFIKRKKRYCSNRAASGSTDGLCSMHTPAGLESAKIQDGISRIRHECETALETIIKHCQNENESDAEHDEKVHHRKQRISAPKRMANPYSVHLTPDIQEHAFGGLYHGDNSPLMAKHTPCNIHIDVGSAKGKCLQYLCNKTERENWNHIGVEIRGNLVDDANRRCGVRIGATEAHEADQPHTPSVESTNNSNSHTMSSTAPLTNKSAMLEVEDSILPLPTQRNIAFVACNFAASADVILRSLQQTQPGGVQLISIQFPDPWRKEKHLRRLIVQPSLLTTFASRLSPGCVFYLSTDCEHVAAHMKQQFETFNAIATAAGSESTSTSDSCNEYCKSHFRQIMSMEEYMVLVGRGVMFPPPLDMPSTNPNPNLATGDVEVAVEGVAAGSRSGCISTKHAGDGWLVNGCFKFNPLGVPSEREYVCEKEWRRVWRFIFVLEKSQ